MAQFKKTNTRTLPKSEEEITPDNIYWKKYKSIVTIKEYGPVTDVSFSEEKPYHFAITSATKVQVYNSISNQVYRNLSRFQQAAYGGTLRPDGKLLVAGGDEGHMKLFDVEAKSMLRVFKGHKGSIHKCNFITNNQQTVSFSDDKTVAVWDIASEQQLVAFNEHQDYVRAGTVSRLNHDMIISGSYDHTIKLFDVRTKKSVITFNHGDPVESVLSYPNGFVIATAGGTSVKLWDLMGTGKLLANLNNHHKTVTCLCLASNNRRLFSGSLDRHIKIHDTTDFKVVHTLDYSSPILSIAVSPEDKTIVTGMADGLFSIQNKPKVKEKKENQNKTKNPYERFLPNEAHYTPSQGDIVVKKEPIKKLPKFDQHLKSYQSSKALDTVLKAYYQSSKPEVTIGVMQELIRRGNIKAALAGRDDATLSPVLKFVIKYIKDTRFSRVLLDIANMLLDIYAPELGQSQKIDNLFSRLRDVTNREMNYMQEVLKLQGTIALVLAGTNQDTY